MFFFKGKAIYSCSCKAYNCSFSAIHEVLHDILRREFTISGQADRIFRCTVLSVAFQVSETMRFLIGVVTVQMH